MKNIELCDAILEILHEWEDLSYEFDGVWLGYETLYDQLKEKYDIVATDNELKQSMRYLKQKGHVQHKPTYDSDGKINGSGWFINWL